MSLIRKHGAVLQAWACLDLVTFKLMPVLRSGEGLYSVDKIADYRKYLHYER